MTGQIFGRKWFPNESDFIESPGGTYLPADFGRPASSRPFHRAGVRQVRQYWLIRPLSARHNGGRWPFRKRAQQCRSGRGMHPTHLPLPILLVLPSVLRPLFPRFSTLVCRSDRSSYSAAILAPTLVAILSSFHPPLFSAISRTPLCHFPRYSSHFPLSFFSIVWL